MQRRHIIPASISLQGSGGSSERTHFAMPH